MKVIFIGAWLGTYAAMALVQGVNPAYELTSLLMVIGMVKVWRTLRHIEDKG